MMRDEEKPTGFERHSSSRTSSTNRSEFDFINKIRKRALSNADSVANKTGPSFIPPPSSLLSGIGDDAAVIREAPGRNTVVTTDLLVEGVDFYRETTTPRLLGQKALAVSLSDIAAMGARPRW